MYVLLALVCLPLAGRERNTTPGSTADAVVDCSPPRPEHKGRTQTQWQCPVSRSTWRVFCVAVADVAGNFLLLWAYQYTSLTSVMLLDFFAIPSAALLSVIFLRVRVRCGGG
jgi:hypothetical protein